MTALGLAAVSYSVVGAATASGLSERTIRQAIKESELQAHYLGTKPIVRAVDLDEWIESLPTEARSSR